MDNKAIFAILAVVIVVAAGAAAFIAFGQEKETEKDPDPHEITIKDSLGKDVTLTVPLTKICTVNTNAAEFIHMFGASDRVVAVDDSLIASMPEIYGKAADCGNYKTPKGDVIADAGAKVVISQSSSRSLSAATEQALKDNYGITVLRIDCYGETMMDDIETLVKVLDTNKAKNALSDYKSMAKDIRDKVLAKSDASGKHPSYLMFFTSLNKFYNENSELCKIVNKIGGHDSLIDMGDNPGTGVTSGPSKEVVFNNGQTIGTDIVLIRGIAGNAATADYQKFLDYGGTSYDYTKLKKGALEDIYVIHTDVLSGPRDYIGYVCIAQAMGIDTGLDYTQLVKDFNEKYGFDVTYSYIMTKFPA
ncbi:MAG: hypothetical protein MJZ21_03185 [archaeon]|nr:hypothetical protein [archaeon]